MHRVQEGLKELVQGRSLSEDLARGCFEEIMQGEVSEPLLGGFLVALRMKGETPEEIATFACVMRERARPLAIAREDLLDTCGTGGDGLESFNVSTLAALVAAGAGAVVAKHGNRAVSGKCGSADLLTRLGVTVDCDEATLARCLNEAGIGFLYAPAMHPAMRHAAPARQALGVRTVFNLLGPLTHPARASHQLMGVFERAWVVPVARALRALGTRRALVVHGLDGMDEITTTAPTAVAELDEGSIREYFLDAMDLGIPRARPQEVSGGDAEVNASIARAILQGEKGPRRNLVVVNAAAALWAARKVRDLQEGRVLSERSLDSGAAAERLDALIRLTRRPGVEA
jgi:anthranilate phosphoribosyltransferase